MESLNSNQTYSGDNSTLPLPEKGLVAYYLASLIIVTLTMYLDVLVLLALIVDRSTVGIVRLVLGNIPAACLVVGVTIIVYDIAGIALVSTDTGYPENIIQFCKLSSVVIEAGGAARFLFLAAFSVTVYYIVRFHRSDKKESNRHAFIGCVIVVIVLWGLAILVSSLVLFDFIVTDSCRYTAIGGIVNVTVYFLVFGIGGFATSITFLLLTTFYIRKHTTSDANHHDPFQKALVKLGFFLLIGNIVNCIGQIVPSIVAAAVSEERETLEASLIIRYNTQVLLDLSLIPTPILLIIYFKPVRMYLKRWVCCCLGKKAGTLAGENGKKNTTMDNTFAVL